MVHVLCILSLLQAVSQPDSASDIPEIIRPFFAPPAQLANDFGRYRSPLAFEDGTPVKTPIDWQKRRQEILTTWRNLTGLWPPLIEKPEVEYLEQTRRDRLIQHKVSVEIAPNKQTVLGYLLVPDPGGQRTVGAGPRACPNGSGQPQGVAPTAIPNPQSEIFNRKGGLPAVLVVYYDAETGAGLNEKELRDFGYQLAKRGFVTLSIGTPAFSSLQPPYKSLWDSPGGQPQLQPLSALAYVAANCYTALANMASVDPERIGIIGHSYGGKWAMFASCLYKKFACAVWSDPGIVFDETRPNVNYWEPWYLGWDPNVQRARGVPSVDRPRTGPYRTMIETGRDLHELHALMAPRPFLVSGGAEDPPQRWQALNHARAVNELLGHRHRVALTTRATHDPTPESNEQLYAFFERFLKPVLRTNP